ncbi:DUF3187 family protein [Vibrio kasasachensis]|uniref:DUF3187 family protein n=1 Tax=Vibrio kasasachensis TaxID=2910248 RepID=UPI003D1300B2
MLKRVLIPMWLIMVAESAMASIQSTPLRTYPTSPYQANSLATQLRSASAPQSTEIFANASMTSVWAHSAEFELDYYQNHAMTGAQWRINSRFSAELKYQYSWAANNHLDTITIKFHDFFGLGQNGRLEAGKHQFSIESQEYDVSVNDFEGEVMVNALHGYLQYQVYEQGPHILSVGGSLYYNDVDDSPFETSSFEQGLQVNYTYLSGNNSFFSTAGITHREEDDLLGGMPVKNNSVALGLGYGRRFARNHEFLIEYHGFEGILNDDSVFSTASHEIVVGYRYYMQNLLIEFTSTENIINMDNSTDIAFGVGLRYFFR